MYKLTTLSKTSLALIVSLSLQGCLFGSDDEDDPGNENPTIEITAGAPSKEDPVHYRITFEWMGTDADGSVVRYEWAVDDDIAAHEWTSTEEVSVELQFDATTQNPKDPDSDLFRDWHSFAVRAIDNEGATSEPAMQTFNAETVAPKSQLLSPPSADPFTSLPTRVFFEWDGEDMDGSRADGRPVAFELKLVQMPFVEGDAAEVESAAREILADGENLLLPSNAEDPSEWERVSADKLGLRPLNLLEDGFAAFAVRAIDEAGAIEPFLDLGRNLVTFRADTPVEPPFVVVWEPSLGRLGSAGVLEVSVPPQRAIQFRWSGSVSHQGARIKSNYGFDIPDPDDETKAPNGIGGWIGWDFRDRMEEPIVFDDTDAGQFFQFYLRVRDFDCAEESESLIQVRIFVAPMTFDRFALVVDDARFLTRPPTDEMHDAFVHETILPRLHELGSVDDRALYRGSPERSQPDTQVEVAELGRYQHVVWSTHAPGGGNLALPTLERERKILSLYSNAGGNLLFLGGRLSSLMTGTSRTGNFRYPKNPPGASDSDFSEDNFVWRFLKYRSTIHSLRRDDQRALEASGLVGLRSQHPAFPDLELDTAKRDPFEVKGGRYVGGTQDYEGVRLGDQPNEGLSGLEPIYTAETFDRTYASGDYDADLSDLMIAHRYRSTEEDRDAGTQHGRVVVMNFQPYWFKEEGLLDAGTSAVHWLVTGQDN